MGLDKFPDMENSDNKRRNELSDGDDAKNLYQSKKPRLPALASVIVEALKVDSLQRFCSSLEPLLRKIVSEEVERALTRLGHSNHTRSCRNPAPRIQGQGERNLQLQFRTRMPPHLFTGGKVEGEQGAPIHVVLVDHSTGVAVQTGPESAAKLNIVVLEGDFNEEAHVDWTSDDFENHEVKEREGKRPLLTGELQLTLKEGVGTLGDLSFTDNSSWIRSRKFRIGLKVAPGYCDGIRVREGKSEAFAVKDHRGELYKKHYPPALHDEVWRLDRIAKDGALHKKLIQANLVTVEDFLRLLVKDPQKLRSILGSGMSNRMWENTVEHAKTCVMGGKLFVYFTDNTHISGVVFNHIYELTGLISHGQFLALESLNHSQKVLVDSTVRKAYENWNQVVEYDGNILGSLDKAKNGVKSSAIPVIDHKHVEDRHYAASNQSMQQYGSSVPSVQRRVEDSNSSGSGLIEYPFMRSDHLLGTATFSNPQLALAGSVDYGNPALGSSYFPVDWMSRQRNGQGLEDIVAEEIRLKSTEMLENDDMQRLLKTIDAGVAHRSDEAACFAYSLQYQPQMYHRPTMQDREKTSGKAVVGWLKLKAALRWGIFIRRKAAERRAQLYELD